MIGKISVVDIVGNIGVVDLIVCGSENIVGWSMVYGRRWREHVGVGVGDPHLIDGKYSTHPLGLDFLESPRGPSCGGGEWIEQAKQALFFHLGWV